LTGAAVKGFLRAVSSRRKPPARTRRPRPWRAPLTAAALALTLAACGARDAGAPLTFEKPETALDYAVALDGAPSEEIDALLRQSLGVFRRQADGAQSPAFLRRRALDDVTTVKRILRSFGYYEADATVAVTPPETEGAPALVTVTVTPGRPFTLAEHRFILIDDGGTPPAALDARALGSPVGAIAAARPILDAETAAVIALRNSGRPYAEARGRDAVADMDAAQIEVDSAIAAGPFFVFGPVAFEGLRRVKPEYLRTYQTWEEGAPYDARKVAAFQRALIETGLFDAGSATPPEEPPEGEAAPIVARLEEGKRRTVTAGGRWSTDTGFALRGALEHRNLFGANETGRAEALLGLEEQRVQLRYREPQYLRPGQDFIAGLELRNLENDAFDETGAVLAAGLERRIGRFWTVSAGGLLEYTDITDTDGSRQFVLAGLPVSALFDDTDDPLNPTRGFRLNANVIPFTGYAEGGGAPLFTRLDATASTYYPIDAERRYILAARGRLGSIIAADDADVPASRRLFSGGGGSVRGYAERFIGPIDENGDPLGGLSVVELGAELRAQAFGDIGFALFVEGGSVSEEPAPVFDEGFQIAAGVGLRYFSPVGPIRVDVGVPVNKREEDDNFQIYLSIGQAF